MGSYGKITPLAKDRSETKSHFSPQIDSSLESISQMLHQTESQSGSYTDSKTDNVGSEPKSQSNDNSLEGARDIQAIISSALVQKSNHTVQETEESPYESVGYELANQKLALDDRFFKKAPDPIKRCERPSECFEEIIQWMDGKFDAKDPEMIQKYRSISECYADQIDHIKKAREYIRQRKDGYTCGGTRYSRFHHNDPGFKLQYYIRNGEVQRGFKLAERIEVSEETLRRGTTHKVRAFNTKTGEIVEYGLDRDTVYAQLDILTRGTIIWKDFSYIDTETGQERSGMFIDEKTGEEKACLYLETIAEYHAEAKKFLGDKDEHGMKLNGIIILINGVEPGKGTTSLHNYKLRSGDIIEIVYKNDAARYDSSNRVVFKIAA